MEKKLLITGADGYLGNNLREYFKDKFKIYCFSRRETKDNNYFYGDIISSKDVHNCVRKVNPDIVFHTAALSSLSLCEKDLQTAEKVNVSGTVNLINAMSKVNPKSKLIFFSSDYVFDGTKGNYKENDILKPKTVYGKTKAISEEKIKLSALNYIIIRTANVFGRGGKFFEYVCKNLTDEISFEAYKDVYYTPTYIDYLLDSISILIDKKYEGTIHLAGKNRLSRFEFAGYVAEKMKKGLSLIKPVNQPNGGLLAKDSSLNTNNSRKILNNYFPGIKDCLKYSLDNSFYRFSSSMKYK